MEVRVIWSDQEVVAAYKPSGVPAQPDRTGDLDLLSAIQKDLGSNIQSVHRLDRPVSGVMLFGRTPKAIASLNAQFREQRIKKTYWAIVAGGLGTDRTLTNSLQHDPRWRKARVVREEEGGAAMVNVATLVKGDRYSLVEVEPVGGAFHQIRAQLAAAGHPIKGDVKYGARRGEKDRSIALHARSIAFLHPSAEEWVTSTAPLPTTDLWKAFTAMLPEGRTP